MINICISCDDNYSEYAGVVTASILKNANKNDKHHFYILDGGVSQENKEKILSLKSIKDCEITFIEIDENKFKIYKNIATHDYLSIAAYYRLKLGELLPNVDKIIYLDCDTIVNTSLSDLFNTDLQNSYVAGVLDVRVKHKKKWKNTKYINSGVLVINLRKIRDDHIEDQYFEYAKNNPEVVQTGDQDIINFVLKDNIKILPDEWNVQVSHFNSRTSYTKYPKIIHYIGNQKPWKFGAVTYFKKDYFNVLELTPWAKQENEKFKWKILNPLYSTLQFVKKRPLFFLRPKFWRAVYYSIK